MQRNEINRLKEIIREKDQKNKIIRKSITKCNAINK